MTASIDIPPPWAKRYSAPNFQHKCPPDLLLKSPQTATPHEQQKTATERQRADVAVMKSVGGQ
jgi:hypothetical protein